MHANVGDAWVAIARKSNIIEGGSQPARSTTQLRPDSASVIRGRAGWSPLVAWLGCCLLLGSSLVMARPASLDKTVTPVSVVTGSGVTGSGVTGPADEVVAPSTAFAEILAPESRDLTHEQLISARGWCQRMLRSIAAIGAGKVGIRPADVTVYGLSREFSCQDVLDVLPMLPAKR